MTAKSILPQIALGEDSTHQFKVDVRNGESLAAEMVTFANSGGGTVFIGVADDGGTPHPGMTMQSSCRAVICSQKARAVWPAVNGQSLRI